LEDLQELVEKLPTDDEKFRTLFIEKVLSKYNKDWKKRENREAVHFLKSKTFKEILDHFLKKDPLKELSEHLQKEKELQKEADEKKSAKEKKAEEDRTQLCDTIEYALIEESITGVMSYDDDDYVKLDYKIVTHFELTPDILQATLSDGDEGIDLNRFLRAFIKQLTEISDADVDKLDDQASLCEALNILYYHSKEKCRIATRYDFDATEAITIHQDRNKKEDQTPSHPADPQKN